MLAGVAAAAGGVSAALACLILRHRQQAPPGLPPPSPKHCEPLPPPSSDAQQQLPQKRNWAPPPRVRSPFHDALRGGNSDSAEKCWDWLSASEEGELDAAGPPEPLAPAGSLPIRQALRRQEAQQQRQQRREEAQQQLGSTAEPRRAADAAVRGPAALRSKSAAAPGGAGYGEDAPELRKTRSASEPAVQDAGSSSWGATVRPACRNGRAAAEDAVLPGLRRVSVCLADDADFRSQALASLAASAGGDGGSVRAVTWGPTIHSMPQPAALSLGGPGVRIFQ